MHLVLSDLACLVFDGEYGNHSWEMPDKLILPEIRGTESEEKRKLESVKL